ncbi:isoprenylcysteine carboxylmethyltransferase family protein [Anaerocolumna sp. AGMB13020]|uniref:methyltransferase family protein n=1 Tax=Anaerocolumna sp. AGMB13020 TaxID=3081750 RepID=UPI002955A836|nr:isoprenylcysteine carboxylmethyltransferase family protein [Anaerocolumna sp. AGMB13020]WOO38421.1 isoprenylcysteine carboxylmethyltransferase family protein [Anaerocolumna sp. AGMB13020]
MNGFLAILPLLIIRFGVLRILDKNSLKRAAHFAPLVGKERSAYWVYQISNLLIFVALCFLKIRTDTYLIYPGLVIYGLGVLLCLLSVIHFAEPAKSGINSRGIYGISRNPMYVAYFIYFIGCAILTRSLPLLGIVIIFQISAHWIILSEERWCIQKFGEEYINYMNKVRRYI